VLMVGDADGDEDGDEDGEALHHSTSAALTLAFNGALETLAFNGALEPLAFIGALETCLNFLKSLHFFFLTMSVPVMDGPVPAVPVPAVPVPVPLLSTVRRDGRLGRLGNLDVAASLVGRNNENELRVTEMTMILMIAETLLL